MTGSSRSHHPIEDRLDALLDRLASGDDLSTLDDPELQSLTAIAQNVRETDDVRWPDDSYADQLVTNLFGEFGHDDGRSATATSPSAPDSWDDEIGDRSERRTRTIPTSDISNAALADDRPSRVRAIAQIAAAIAGFGLLTLLLVTMFRGFGDESPAAVGSGEPHPPQLAVTMQTDPVNGNPDIFLVSLDGSEPVNLTDNPANDTFPAWSPDGSKIAFVSDRNGKDALYVMDADGGNLEAINEPSSADDLKLSNPAWSPKGDAVAVVRFDSTAIPGGSLSSVIVINAQTEEQYPVRTVEGYSAPNFFNGRLVWSPDGRWLLYGASGPDDSRLFIADVTFPVEQPRLLPVVADIPGDTADWTIGNEIVAAEDGELSVFQFDPDTENVEELRTIDVDGTRRPSSPVWSPDGTMLAFPRSSIGGSSLWFSNSDGSLIEEVPDSTTGTYPAWSNSNQLAFLRFGALFSAESTGYDLMLFDPASQSLTRLIDTGFSGPLLSPPVWRPGETLPSPDESRPAATTIPAVTGTPTPDPIMITPTPSGQDLDLLVPPRARLRSGNTLVDSYFGSYAWQFSDADQTFANIEAPVVVFENEPVEIERGEQLALEIYGEEFTRPPMSTTIEVYNLDENQQVQTGPAGRPEPDPQFTIWTDSMLTIEAEDPAGPLFTLNQPPDRYAVVVRSGWGMHPDLSREIFVTWVFHIEVIDWR